MDTYVKITWIFRNLWKILTIFVVVTVILIKYLKCHSWFSVSGLFFNLEGTALLGSALSPPADELAVSGGVRKFIINCLQYYYPVKFNPVLFFLGIFFIIVGIIITFCLN
jgi:hypothetical protein